VKPSEYKETVKVLLENNDYPSVLALGPPGIGKTAIPQEAASELNIPVTICRLTLLNPTDLRGIPFVVEVENRETNEVKKDAVWAWPGFLPRNDGRTHLVILDDLSNSPRTIQSMAYGMTLEKKAGEHDLAHCRFLGTGNRVQDASGSYAVSLALLNRCELINLKPDLDESKIHAFKRGWDPSIAAYWNFDSKSLFDFNPKKTGNLSPFPSPRSWEMVNKALKVYGNRITQERLAGFIGEGYASQFKNFVLVKDRLPNPDAILRGKSDKVPKEKSVLHVLISTFISRFANHNSDLEKSVIVERLLEYSKKIPGEFSVLLFQDLVTLDRACVTKAEGWREWAKEHEDIIC